MNRRTRMLLVLAIAVGLAALASFLVYRAVQRIPVREVEVAHYYVVVASRPAQMGTRLTPDHVKLAAWPKASPVPGSFTDRDAVVDRGLLAPVLENEPITESKLAPKEAGAGLAPTIPAGMLAVSVKVNEVVGVAGFVVPGARVDVLVALRSQDSRMARIVVTNVQVLAAGTRTDQEPARDGEPIQASVVTLLVTPQDAERIALASNEGRIMLALRNPLDMAPSATFGVRLASLMAAPEPVQVEKTSSGTRVRRLPPPKPPVPAARPYTVEAIRAAKRTEEPVRQ